MRADVLVFIFLGVVAIVFAVGILRGNPVFEMVLMSLSLAVAAIPEGLPAVDLFYFLTLIGFSWRGARSHDEYVTAFREAFFGPSA